MKNKQGGFTLVEIAIVPLLALALTCCNHDCGSVAGWSIEGAGVDFSSQDQECV